MPVVYIVLLNWNGWADTIACLQSLRTLHTPHRVVVVDNASRNDSVSRIKQAFPEIPVLQSGGNLGFSGGNNVGIRHALEAGADYVWLLNNDTLVFPDSLEELLKTADQCPGAGVIGSVLYYLEQPERVQAWGGGKIIMPLGIARHYLEAQPLGKTSYITGASMLIRREVLEQVGLLDDGFFMYWEDTDYSFRVRRAGWEIAVAPGSKILHKESASLGQYNPVTIGYRNRSALRFFRKHSRWGVLPALIGILARTLKARLGKVVS
ncbi:hypothetical protein HNR42_001030 [Deinobacterium chartae]|uniref:Glycosyltransferase 2-like domain-containing protein n=1 Tax=Deinobacterium chartae TaxID=521158 RepID=A0A841HXM3_9DEIO|nr:glycosyltransferase family 2 protein [Deinobacterium chartae]MBB6097613.1 hypothetical protein [Deinobacterium chartae]